MARKLILGSTFYLRLEIFEVTFLNDDGGFGNFVFLDCRSCIGLSLENLREEYYAWGLNQIARAVSFLNNDCKLVGLLSTGLNVFFSMEQCVII